MTTATVRPFRELDPETVEIVEPVAWLGASGPPHLHRELGSLHTPMGLPLPWVAWLRMARDCEGLTE